MTATAEDKIKALARRCAHSNLRLRDAQNLFHTLYFADALKNNRGNVTHAAEAAGVNRECFIRYRAKLEKARGDS